MPLHDLVQQHILPADVTAIDQALEDLENAVKDKIRNLAPDERRTYGSINETNKLLVNKVRDYRLAQPALSSPDVNWDEFMADYEDRRLLETRINRLHSILEGLQNAKILHDYDNFQNSLVDYAFTQYKKDTEAGGYLTKFTELKQFFPRTGVSSASSSPKQEV